ncbi:iron complex transport system ATP-binding protein [Microvirga flocculans]|uniref:Iron complex transport system ATP-binding protein n=1 Tax=Microvirga flocculans TaxID=217168 RepID=A0A7W6IDA6_9HYPH|nr:heme ABC transporter ATP-binding protein [Microvirga flocculans]MBB4038815.1 iron complex transport system ATP-binding protein [Microvirga flocculans]
MNTLLQAEGLSYGSGDRMLIDGIDLAFAGGSFTVIIGPNGAGKSTLLRLLSGELHPSRGTVRWNGESLNAIPAWRLAHRRAVMPQASDLTFPFTVLEVASLGTQGIGRGLSRGDRRRLAHEALEQADVAHLAQRNYQTLSGGERQRVHFARVLAQLTAGRTLETQQILFLDEPIASLDLKHQLALLQTARTLARDGLCVIAVLHDLQLSADLADDLVLLERGRLIGRGTPGAVLTPTRLAEVFGVTLNASPLPPSPWRLAVA